ncbi:MAG: DUF502 domain-containing protein [Phycisphaerae bacterium]|nr:DUF502 domain-containing protein [Phycisphaerae bacterium]
MPETIRRPQFEFRRAFLRGLAVLLPSVLTLWILVAAYQFITRNVAEPINGMARAALAWSSTASGPLNGRFEPTNSAVDAVLAEQASNRRPLARDDVVAQLRYREVAEWWERSGYAGFFGLVVALGGVYVAGRLVGGWLGRRLFLLIERILTSVPLIKQVYPHIKQIVGFFFSDAGQDDASSGKMKFSRVVLVEYPRRGVWSVGLMTGTAMRAIENETGEALTIFIPSSPTPFTGWTITALRQDVHELPISIDEALRYLVSGGVLVPTHQESPPRDPLPPTAARADNTRSTDRAEASLTPH